MNNLINIQNLKINSSWSLFLDRDGVINKNRAKGVTSKSGFKFIRGAKKAISLLTKDGFPVIVITNQPYVGNKEMTEKNLDNIHQYMKDEIFVVKAGLRHNNFCMDFLSI